MEDHDKIGLIGANGTGKTTLFKMLLDGQTPDGGDFFLTKTTNFGYLEQHIGLDSELNVYDELLTVFERVRDIEDKITELTGAMEAGLETGTEAADRLHALTEKYAELDGYTYKNVAKASLLGMGFSEDDLKKPFSSLSGGQKTRVYLCKILLGDANLLLL
ncbi:MAG: ABC-F family ATP-binding cassette domain-containing protein, partial [Clostridia bacterium]|nr:ABC-F family ATP-binding cassette domain-containing protein [Clostridia bacterium]